MSDCKDAEIQARHLIRQFQRKVRAEGLPVECNAFRDPVLLRGRITQITEYRIKVRLHEPRYWRIRLTTWTDWWHMGYRALEVDLNNQSVRLSKCAHAKVEFLLRLAWIRAKHSRQA